VDICGRESQKLEPGIDKPVLPSIVLHQALTVVAAIKLEDESRRGIVEISSTQEVLVPVVKVRLNLRGG
jgi:hypothetical protein